MSERRSVELGTTGAASVVDPVLDLARRQPGQQVREQADRARRAAPVNAFFARLLNVHTQERAWSTGAHGEEAVGRQLAALVAKDPRWRVLHSIPVGSRGADIDHVVIGPGGVFTVNTKHHRGARLWIGGNTFLVNGVRQPYVRNSRHEAERAGRMLGRACGFPVTPTGLIVPVNAGQITVREPPLDVHVVNRRALRRWLRRRVPTLSPAAVDRIYDAARRPATWS